MKSLPDTINNLQGLSALLIEVSAELDDLVRFFTSAVFHRSYAATTRRAATGTRRNHIRRNGRTAEAQTRTPAQGGASRTNTGATGRSAAQSRPWQRWQSKTNSSGTASDSERLASTPGTPTDQREPGGAGPEVSVLPAPGIRDLQSPEHRTTSREVGRRETRPRNPGERLRLLLEQSGAVLVRHKKHLVYRLPNGRSYTCASTPSDWRAVLNQITQLKRLLGAEIPGALGA